MISSITMGKIVWEKNKIEENSVEKEQEEILKRITKPVQKGFIEKNVSLSHTANQFIIRLPTQLTQFLKLDPKKAGDYKMKIKWSSADFDEKTDSIKGEFEIKKDSERS